MGFTIKTAMESRNYDYFYNVVILLQLIAKKYLIFIKGTDSAGDIYNGKAPVSWGQRRWQGGGD